jgi:hypothetical protein
MGLVLGFIFLFAAVASLIIILISYFVLKNLKGNPSKGKHLSNFAIAILAAAIFVFIDFSLYPAIENHGAPSGEDYNLLAIKAGILGLSLGVGYIFTMVFRIIQSLVQRTKI